MQALATYFTQLVAGIVDGAQIGGGYIETLINTVFAFIFNIIKDIGITYAENKWIYDLINTIFHQPVYPTL
jgi:hypothetical protein